MYPKAWKYDVLYNGLVLRGYSYKGGDFVLNLNGTKKVADILEIREGNIAEFDKLGVDAIVNAAKPTLMGGSGVDGAIHAAMDQKLNTNAGAGKTFNDLIKEELNEPGSPDDKIRCMPGKVVVTKGVAGTVDRVIHAVGPQYDKGSGCIHTLQNCYKEIMKAIKEYGIHKAAVPIISSGNYNFPFDLALRIAIVTIGNELIAMKEKDINAYQQIEKIYLLIYKEKDSDEAIRVYKKYEPLLVQEKRMMACGAWELHKAYVNEVYYNDTKRRGYFTLTKLIRLFLVSIRSIFVLSFLLQYLTGKKGWKVKKQAIEIETIVKVILPVLLALFVWKNPGTRLLPVICGIIIYTGADTLTCLAGLVFLTDIYEPSANPIRSISMVLMNYLELSLDMSVIYYIYHLGKIGYLRALDFGLLNAGDMIYGEGSPEWIEHVLHYTNSGIKFFIVALMFAYFVGHLKQREFVSGKN